MKRTMKRLRYPMNKRDTKFASKMLPFLVNNYCECQAICPGNLFSIGRNTKNRIASMHRSVVTTATYDYFDGGIGIKVLADFWGIRIPHCSVLMRRIHDLLASGNKEVMQLYGDVKLMWFNIDSKPDE